MQRRADLFVQMRVAQLQRSVAENDGQNVVKIVRYAGSESADCFHLLRLAQFAFQAHTISDVLKNEEMIWRAAELEIFCRYEHLADFACGRTNGRGQITHGGSRREG